MEQIKPRIGIEKGMLVGMGNPLLDMSANVDLELLNKYGLKADNAILAEGSHLPLYKELESRSDTDYVAGGATLNTMRVGQWLLQTPHVFSYFGSIGDDPNAKRLIDNATSAGVNMKPQVNTKNPTGTCAVLVTGEGKHRSLVANLASANDFTKDHFNDKEIWDIVERADYFYIGGFFLTVSPESILQVAKHACEKNKFLMMNLSAPFLCQFFAEPMAKCFPYVDVLFGNESEAVAFSKQQNFGTEDIKTIALKTAEMEKQNKNRQRMVVFTQGCEPTIVVHEGRVTEYAINAIKPEDIVDTNGAGDSFVGGFLSQFIQGCDVQRCVDIGNYAANYIIRQSGVSLNDEPSF